MGVRILFHIHEIICPFAQNFCHCSGDVFQRLFSVFRILHSSINGLVTKTAHRVQEKLSPKRMPEVSCPSSWLSHSLVMLAHVISISYLRKAPEKGATGSPLSEYLILAIMLSG